MGRRKRPQLVNVTSVATQEDTMEVNGITGTCSNTQANSPNEDNEDHDLENFSNEDLQGSPTPKRRGITLMTHIWNQPKEKRIVVEWNKYWQPISGERSDLAHFLGTISRNPNLCSMAYNDWRLLRKKEDGGLLKIVKSKFIIPHPLAEKFVMSSMGKKWSNFKTELKLQYCEPCRGNITNVLSNKPDIVPKDQWVSLVTYWFSDSGKRHSLINRKSREQQVMVHTAGAKSFAVLYAEKTVNGVPPSRAHVYLESHKDRKTRPAPMDAKSQQAVDMIKEKLSQLPNGIEVTNGNVAWDGDVYSQVMKEVIGPERSGRVRGLGRGPSSLVSMSPNQEEHIDTEDHDVCDERIEFLEVQIAKMKEKQEEDAEIQNQLRNELSIIKAMLLGRTPNDHVPS